MSFTDPQPGDKTPRDHARPGDSDELRGLHGPDDIAGDRAPSDVTSATAPATSTLCISPRPSSSVPVATFLLSLAIIIAGAVAYTLLPVSSLPKSSIPSSP